jgi:hypothetical protein
MRRRSSTLCYKAFIFRMGPTIGQIGTRTNGGGLLPKGNLSTSCVLSPYTRPQRRGDGVHSQRKPEYRLQLFAVLRPY